MHKISTNKHLSLTGIAGGALLLMLGFLYEILFAGIPYQDPTSSMIQRYDFHQAIGQTIEWIGVLVFVLSIIGIIIHTLQKAKTK
jgi:hypothetical protein